MGVKCFIILCITMLKELGGGQVWQLVYNIPVHEKFIYCFILINVTATSSWPWALGFEPVKSV